MGFACLAALLLVVFLIGPVAADKKPVMLVKEWPGSVEDEGLMQGAPTVVTSAARLEKLYKDWKLADKPPQVDFKKELVIIAVTRGSKLRLSAVLDDTSGNLLILGLATRDLRPGFRYVIATVSREGVKTVDGKELPKE
jgi:hypothetical protein